MSFWDDRRHGQRPDRDDQGLRRMDAAMQALEGVAAMRKSQGDAALTEVVTALSRAWPLLKNDLRDERAFADECRELLRKERGKCHGKHMRVRALEAELLAARGESQ